MGENRMSYGNRGGRGGFGGGGYGGRSSSSSGFGSSFKPKPVEVGKEYDVTISDTSRRGEGIAKIDGFVIFVAGAKQGQSARIKVTRVTDRFATGEVVNGAAKTETTSESAESSAEEQPSA
jgi:predicted RNA-binding protein with TRAM domain